MISRFLGKVIYRGLWLLGGVIYLLPFGVKNRLAYVLSLFWFYVVRFRTRIILHNLSHVFARNPQESMNDFKLRCEALARKNLQHYILSAFEVFERFHWSKAVVERKVEIKGLEQLARLKAENRGYFAMTAHLGNWELITLVGVFLNTRLAVVTKFLRNPFFDNLWVESRKHFGLELLNERGSGLSIVRAVKAGKAVGFVMDQHTGNPHGIETTFLGLKAWSPKGLAILSTRLKAAIIPAYILRKPDGNFFLSIEAPLAFKAIETNLLYRTESGTLTEEGLRYHVRVCNENMEQWIRREPAQYLWLHRRFKNILDYRAPLVWQS